MYQTDRGNYKTKESVTHMFTHSCLGRFIILAVVIVILLIIAAVTKPSLETTELETMDNVAQCIAENDSTKTDGIDDALNNIAFTFTHVDSTEVNPQMIDAFLNYNKIVTHKHLFYTTAHIQNNFRPDGRRAGIGIFGMVVSTINFNDLILYVGPIHKGYGKKLIKTSTPEYFGKNPGIEEFHYKRDPRD